MKFYQELTLIPDVDVSLNFLWSKLYTQLHLALVENKAQHGTICVGIGFPDYKQVENNITLGKKIRVFAPDEVSLQQLELSRWLVRLTDYVHYTGIRTVPTRANSFAIYQRYQPKSNSERLARRYAKRHNLTTEEALAHYAKYREKRCNLPFIRLKSLSNEHQFRLFIERKLVNELVNQGFNTYGLSSVSSIPEF